MNHKGANLKPPIKQRWIISGFGGQGILFLGRLLGTAAIIENLDCTVLSSYGAEMRGGTANCRIILANYPIGSPLIPKVDVVLALNKPSVKRFAPLLEPNGTIILNSTLTDEYSLPDSITSIKIPATELADKAGNIRVANIIALGAYLAYNENIISCSVIHQALVKVIGDKKPEIIDTNHKALDLGYEYVKKNNLLCKKN